MSPPPVLPSSPASPRGSAFVRSCLRYLPGLLICILSVGLFVAGYFVDTLNQYWGSACQGIGGIGLDHGAQRLHKAYRVRSHVAEREGPDLADDIASLGPKMIRFLRRIWGLIPRPRDDGMELPLVEIDAAFNADTAPDDIESVSHDKNKPSWWHISRRDYEEKWRKNLGEPGHLNSGAEATGTSKAGLRRRTRASNYGELGDKTRSHMKDVLHMNACVDRLQESLSKAEPPEHPSSSTESLLTQIDDARGRQQMSFEEVGHNLNLIASLPESLKVALEKICAMLDLFDESLEEMRTLMRSINSLLEYSPKSGLTRKQTEWLHAKWSAFVQHWDALTTANTTIGAYSQALLSNPTVLLYSRTAPARGN